MNDEFDFIYTVILGLMLLYKASKLGARWTRLMQSIRMRKLFLHNTVNRDNCAAKVLGLYDGTQLPKTLTAAQLGPRKLDIFFCMKTQRVYSVIAGQWV